MASRLMAGIGWRFRVGRARLTELLRRFLPHNVIYDQRYFQYIDREASASAEGIVRGLVTRFAPSAVLDVGCGTGAMLHRLREAGVKRVVGLEYAAAALDVCESRGLEVHKFDLESNESLQFECGFDLVMSMEVAEHLPPEVAPRYAALLADQKATLVMTAASPGQGGTDHVNEQPQSYWIELLSVHGMRYSASHSDWMRREWERAGVTAWYHQNVMVFLPSSEN